MHVLYVYTYSIEIIACTNLFTVPSWNLLPATGTEGDTVAVCATLFGLPANGLECDFVLQLIISEETIPNTGTHLLFYHTTRGGYKFVCTDLFLNSSVHCIRYIDHNQSYSY